MAVKNVSPWIVESITSVLTQAVQPVECIVVDDGSSDDTVAQVLSLDDTRVRLIQNPSSGGGTARNVGVTYAAGEFLAFADGDDVVPYRGYEALIDQSRRTGAEMVVGSYVIQTSTQLNTRQQWTGLYSEAREGLRIEEHPQYLRDRVCWNRVFRRDSWNEAGVAFTDASRSNDIVAMTEAYCAFAFDVVPAHVYVYRRRMGASSMTARRHDPASVAAHFQQELLCTAAIMQLQDPRAIGLYATEMLLNDVWAHLTPLLQAQNTNEPGFEDARRAAQAVISELIRYASMDSDPLKRLTYALVDASDWEFAAALNDGTSEATRRFVGKENDLARRLRSRRIDPRVHVAAILSSSIVPVLRNHDELSDEQLASALSQGQRLARVAGVRGRLDHAERYLLSAPLHSFEAARSHLSSEVPAPRTPARVADLVVRAGRTTARITHGAFRGIREEILASIDNHPGPVHRIAERTPWRVRYAVRRLLGRQ